MVNDAAADGDAGGADFVLDETFFPASPPSPAERFRPMALTE